MSRYPRSTPLIPVVVKRVTKSPSGYYVRYTVKRGDISHDRDVLVHMGPFVTLEEANIELERIGIDNAEVIKR